METILKRRIHMKIYKIIITVLVWCAMTIGAAMLGEKMGKWLMADI
jgi:hypothetical protein